MRLGILAGRSLAPNFHAVLGTMAGLLEEHATCDLIVGDPDPPAAIASAYRLVRYPSKVGRVTGFVADLVACVRYCRRHRPDVLMNASQPQTLGLAVALVGRLGGTRSVVKMSGESFRQVKLARGLVRRCKSWIIHEMMAGLAYRLANRVVAVGETLRDDLVKRYPDMAGRTVVLTQPVDVRRFRPLALEQKAALRARLGFGEGDRLLLYVGRLSYLKGADRLVEIVWRVAAADPRVRFCAVGEGEFEQALRAVGAAVILPGRVPHDEVHAYYQASDLFVFPSRTEGLPNTILEALACGLPVIAAPVGDIPNWVSNLATEPEDYVRRILVGDYVVDELPVSMGWEAQKAAYRAFFTSVIAG